MVHYNMPYTISAGAVEPQIETGRCCWGYSTAPRQRTDPVHLSIAWRQLLEPTNPVLVQSRCAKDPPSRNNYSLKVESRQPNVK